jgi:hypothetical protein
VTSLTGTKLRTGTAGHGTAPGPYRAFYTSELFPPEAKNEVWSEFIDSTHAVREKNG